MKSIEDVRNFWQTNPLFSGESRFDVGSKEFFEDHKRVYLDDVFTGNFRDQLLIPQDLLPEAKILDLGCGIGFWTVEFLVHDS